VPGDRLRCICGEPDRAGWSLTHTLLWEQIPGWMLDWAVESRWRASLLFLDTPIEAEFQGKLRPFRKKPVRRSPATTKASSVLRRHLGRPPVRHG
jgi:hypothetical protein